jgi:hypothetical protein
LRAVKKRGDAARHCAGPPVNFADRTACSHTDILDRLDTLGTMVASLQIGLLPCSDVSTFFFNPDAAEFFPGQSQTMQPQPSSNADTVSPAAPNGHVAEAEDPSGQVAEEQSPLPPPLCRHRRDDLADEDEEFAANFPADKVHAGQEGSQVVADDLVCEQANGPLYSFLLTAHGDAARALGKDEETAAAEIENNDDVDDADHHLGDEDAAAAAITSACIDLLKEPGQQPGQQQTGVDHDDADGTPFFRAQGSTAAVVERVGDLPGKDAAKSLEVEVATAAESARVEIRRVSQFYDDPKILAKIAFIRLFRSKLCTTVQAPPIVRGVLCAEGYAIDDESLQLICKTVAGLWPV